MVLKIRKVEGFGCGCSSFSFFFFSEKWESSGFLEKWVAVGPFSSPFWVYRVLRRKSNEKVQSFDFSANHCLEIERE